MHHNAPFSIPEIKSFIPEKVKPWILFVFFIIYQLSGGVYMAAVADMSGSLALMQEDILMAGFASLVGLGLTFTIMFRLKFRFSTKTSLTATALGLVACNLICAHTSSVPILVAASFVAGFFRMWGTFACNSTIQLWVTPTRNMAVWFCYIQLCVQCFLQLSGLTTIYVAFLSQWEYMHWLIIGCLLVLTLVTQVTFRHHRFMKPLPLFGIDWMGAALWATTLLCSIFVLNYGDYYNWYDSRYIWMGTLAGAAALVLNVWRASFIRHPFISNQTWRYRNVWLTFLLLAVTNILLGPSHTLEHIYTSSILRYDELNLISLNWIVLLGIICGAVFTYATFAKLKWRYKTMTTIGFSFLVGYLMVMYFTIDYNLPKEMLFLPLLLRGVGSIIITITLITALSVVPFHHFAQSLTVQSFMSACLGSMLGTAILTYAFKHVTAKNIVLLSPNLDRVNTAVSHIPAGNIYGGLQQHAMLLSMKEIYGWLGLLGIFCLLAFLLRESSLRPQSLHPKFKSIRRALKHELKLDKLAPEE
ncbi:hypothetical protein [Alistipes sp. ZOR0009]|uniref:hypothetical protein n=1 Tax=Alistipes sp. ZOR0009 TaxID=1339253 RepID=UPI000648988E|nr:hypothetical protein [Alistipes sp. ZOR0009]